jgi:hypothetical protein
MPAVAYDQQMEPVESREEWEQGLREMQQSITPAQGLRAAHQVAKRSSGAPIPDFAHLVRLVLGGALLALGIVALSSRIPYGSPSARPLSLPAVGWGPLRFAGNTNRDEPRRTGKPGRRWKRLAKPMLARTGKGSLAPLGMTELGEGESSLAF